MEFHDSILAAFDAYAALIQFDVAVPGEERLLFSGAVSAGLARRGITTDQHVIWGIADFLPIALARPSLRELGIRLHDHYGRIDSKGRLRSYRRLTDEPIYCNAEKMHGELFAIDAKVARALCAISVEHQLIQTALKNGSRATDLESGPPILDGPDELCPPLNQQPVFAETPFWLRSLQRQHRPWWKLW